MNFEADFIQQRWSQMTQFLIALAGVVKLLKSEVLAVMMGLEGLVQYCSCSAGGRFEVIHAAVYPQLSVIGSLKIQPLNSGRSFI